MRKAKDKSGRMSAQETLELWQAVQADRRCAGP